MSDVAIRRPSAGMPKEVLLCAAALIALAVDRRDRGRLTGVGKTQSQGATRPKLCAALRRSGRRLGPCPPRGRRRRYLYDRPRDERLHARDAARPRAGAQALRHRRRDAVPAHAWGDGRMSLDDTTTGRRCGARSLRGNKRRRLRPALLASGEQK